MQKIAIIFKKNWRYLLGGVIGSIGGYLYWYYIGCSSGTCPITASPTSSIIWGALMGALLFSSFESKKKNK